MNKDIYRNIAAVTAIFIISLSVMLITNYFQVRGVTPLQTEVVETLKLLNDTNPDNPELQEQIRQLDLLARRAYFIQADHLKLGVYILLGMVAVFVVCLRFYFKGEMHIPDKEIDPIDEWMLKSKSRKYITWSMFGLVGVSLFFVFLSSPFLATEKTESVAEETLIAESTQVEPDSEVIEPAIDIEEPMNEVIIDTTNDVTPVEEAFPATSEEPQPVVPKITHNAFRGNYSNGVSAAKGIPVKWDLGSGTNIAWKKEIPRPGHNSPIINGNHVFFTGADEQARELYCYDLTTGEQRWSLAATNIPGSPSVMPKVTEDTGLASSSVATDGNRVCAIFATGDVVCADMDGKQLWAKNLGVPDNHYGFVSSLLIFGNTLFIQYDNNKDPKLIALDVANGNQRWVKNRPGKICWSSPSIAYVNRKPQLILMGNPAITAYDPNSGEQLWQVDCMGGEVCSCPCSIDGVIFGANEYAKLVAINGADGKVLWESSDYLPEVSSPVATKDHLYVATSYGVLAAYDTKTGALAKEHELNVEFYSFTDGKIVVRTEKSIYCVAMN